MASVNKFLSKLNQATTALKSVKGISSKIFGTGYQTNVSTQEQDVEIERRRLQERAKGLKSKNIGLNMIPKYEAKIDPSPPATELVYPKDNPVDNYIHFTIQPRKKREGDAGKSALSDSATEIYLYAPNVKNDTPSISYNNIEFGNVQRDILSGGLPDFDGGLSAEGREILAKSLGRLISFGTNDFADDRTFNPQKEVMFEGIQFRTFDMSFQFRPNSLDETEEINNIIWAFKTAMLPDTFQLAQNLGREASEFSENYFNLPNSVNIEWVGAIKKRIDGFLPSFITNVSVQYNGGNKLETFGDGMPLVVDMNLSFVENVLMTQENYQSLTVSSKKVDLKKSPSIRELKDQKESSEVKLNKAAIDNAIQSPYKDPGYTAIDGTQFKNGKIVYQRPYGAG